MSETKRVYIFDQDSKVFSGHYDAQKSPLEPDVFICPTNSTEKAPPLTGDYEAAIFDERADKWLVVPDYRGMPIYDQVTGQVAECTQLGEITTGWALTPPPKTFDVLQAEKLNEIKQARDVAEFGPFEYAGMLFDGNAQSKLRIIGAVTGAVLAVQNGEPGKTWSWTLADNSVVTLTAAQVIAMGAAAEAAVQAAFARGREVRDEIYALQPGQTAELDAISW